MPNENNQDVMELKSRVQLLEYQTLQQNESTAATMREMQRVLTEIHNKLDDYILAESVKRAEDKKDIRQNYRTIQSLSEDLEKHKEKQDARTWKILGLVLTVSTFLGGSIYAVQDRISIPPKVQIEQHSGEK